MLLNALAVYWQSMLSKQCQYIDNQSQNEAHLFIGIAVKMTACLLTANVCQGDPSIITANAVKVTLVRVVSASAEFDSHSPLKRVWESIASLEVKTAL